jgi:hypothetical protein
MADSTRPFDAPSAKNSPENIDFSGVRPGELFSTNPLGSTSNSIGAFRLPEERNKSNLFHRMNTVGSRGYSPGTVSLKNKVGGELSLNLEKKAELEEIKRLREINLILVSKLEGRIDVLSEGLISELSKEDAKTAQVFFSSVISKIKNLQKAGTVVSLTEANTETEKAGVYIDSIIKSVKTEISLREKKIKDLGEKLLELESNKKNETLSQTPEKVTETAPVPLENKGILRGNSFASRIISPLVIATSLATPVKSVALDKNTKTSSSQETSFVKKTSRTLTRPQTLKRTSLPVGSSAARNASYSSPTSSSYSYQQPVDEAKKITEGASSLQNNEIKTVEHLDPKAALDELNKKRNETLHEIAILESQIMSSASSDTKENKLKVEHLKDESSMIQNEIVKTAEEVVHYKEKPSVGKITLNALKAKFGKTRDTSLATNPFSKQVSEILGSDGRLTVEKPAASKTIEAKNLLSKTAPEIIAQKTEPATAHEQSSTLNIPKEAVTERRSEPQLNPEKAKQHRHTKVGNLYSVTESWVKDWKRGMTPYPVKSISTVSYSLNHEKNRTLKDMDDFTDLLSVDSKKFLHDFKTKKYEALLTTYLPSLSSGLSNPSKLGEVSEFICEDLLSSPNAHLYGLIDDQRKELCEFITFQQSLIMAVRGETISGTKYTLDTKGITLFGLYEQARKAVEQQNN